MDKIRYFIGLPPDNDAQKRVAQQVEQHKATWQFAKWTHPQDYHITLAFLGDLELDKADEVRELLQQHEFHIPSFPVVIQKWGTFGPSKKPSILWAGIESSQELLALHTEVWSLMETIGFEKEQRPFRPHVTIARRSQGTTADEIASTGAPSNVSWQVSDIVLFQTYFGRRPAYERVLRLPMQNHR